MAFSIDPYSPWASKPQQFNGHSYHYPSQSAQEPNGQDSYNRQLDYVTRSHQGDAHSRHVSSASLQDHFTTNTLSLDDVHSRQIYNKNLHLQQNYMPALDYGDVHQRQSFASTHSHASHSSYTGPFTYTPATANIGHFYGSYTNQNIQYSQVLPSKQQSYYNTAPELYTNHLSLAQAAPVKVAAAAYGMDYLQRPLTAQKVNNIDPPARKQEPQQSSLHLAAFLSNTVTAFAAQATLGAGEHVPLDASGDPTLSAFTNQLLSIALVPPQSIFLALRYLNQYFANKQQLTTHQDLRHLLAGALVLANKFVDDNTYTNSTWAEATGIPLGDLNRVERDILFGLRFSLLVSEEEYELWLDDLSRYIDMRRDAAGVDLKGDPDAQRQIALDRAGLVKAEERREYERRSSLQHRRAYEQVNSDDPSEDIMAGPIPEEYRPLYARAGSDCKTPQPSTLGRPLSRQARDRVRSRLGQWLHEHSAHPLPTLVGGR